MMPDRARNGQRINIFEPSIPASSDTLYIMPVFDVSTYHFDAILFDCDGTLVNSAPLHFAAFQAALERQGASLDRDWYMRRLGLTREELLLELSEQFSVQLDVPRAVTDSETEFVQRTKQLTEIPEVADVARSCFGKVPLAVASSGQRQSVLSSLNSVGIANLFAAVLTADDVVACKPDPAIYIAAAKALGVDASKCLVFEDTEEGIRSGTAAGAQVIDVRKFAAIYG